MTYLACITAAIMMLATNTSKMSGYEGLHVYLRDVVSIQGAFFWASIAIWVAVMAIVLIGRRRADGRQIRGRDGELTDCLTPDDSFRHMPSDEDIEHLPYIDPSVRREAPGVFYILTGPNRKGPYPSRAEASADIRAGNW